MLKILAILLLSFGFTAGLAVPFINLLYRLKFRAPTVTSKDMFGRKTPFNDIQGHKVGTPTGGGILIVLAVMAFAALFYGVTKYSVNWTAGILFLTLILFGGLGLYDDLRKFFDFGKTGFFGLQIRQKFLLQLGVAVTIAYLLFSKMGLSSINLPLLGELPLGWLFIPYATLVITFFTNAFNITDGLDGLAGGLLEIALLPLWYLSPQSAVGGDVSLFIAIIFGAVLAFLYFNVAPARFFMGDTGALALGATLAVLALTINASIPLFIIGAVFVVEASSTLLQWGSMFLRHGQKIFKIAPLHHHFQAVGWEETKITMRFWLGGVLLAMVGLFIALV